MTIKDYNEKVDKLRKHAARVKKDLRNLQMEYFDEHSLPDGDVKSIRKNSKLWNSLFRATRPNSTENSTRLAILYNRRPIYLKGS